MTGSMLGAEYTQDMNNSLVTQMHERINVAFHVRTKNGRYTENMKCETNVALDHKNEIIDRKDELHNRRDELLDCMNEIKIKHDYFSIFGENERKYVTAIGGVCLTSTLPLRHSEPDLNTHNSKPDLHDDHPPKFQKSSGGQGFS